MKAENKGEEGERGVNQNCGLRSLMEHTSEEGNENLKKKG